MIHHSQSFQLLLLYDKKKSLQGGYAGNALGFKVASLNKLMDTRANKPRVTLLHYLVDEAEEQHEEDVLSFADELSQSLTPASRC